MSGSPYCEVCGHRPGANISRQGVWTCDRHFHQYTGLGDDAPVPVNYDWKTGEPLPPGQVDHPHGSTPLAAADRDDVGGLADSGDDTDADDPARPTSTAAGDGQPGGRPPNAPNRVTLTCQGCEAELGRTTPTATTSRVTVTVISGFAPGAVQVSGPDLEVALDPDHGPVDRARPPDPDPAPPLSEPRRRSCSS